MLRGDYNQSVQQSDVQAESVRQDCGVLVYQARGKAVGNPHVLGLKVLRRTLADGTKIVLHEGSVKDFKYNGSMCRTDVVRCPSRAGDRKAAAAVGQALA